MQGPSREHLLVVLQGLGALVRGAGPPQPPIEIDQHDPGGVGVEQLLGRHHRLVQGGGQVLVGVQVAQGADALGQHRRVDRHGRAFGPVAELANPVNRPGTTMALGCRSGPTAPRDRVGSTPIPPEPALPPYSPAGRQGTCQSARWLPARLGGGCSGRSPLSTAWYQAAERGWTEIPSPSVSWPEQPPPAPPLIKR